VSHGFLLDTNIPSEQIRSRPDPHVGTWLYAQPESLLYLSAVTIGELRNGFVLLPASKRRAELELWFETDLIPRFQNRILPVTRAIADRWGTLNAEARLRGTPLTTADGMIAATALEHSLTLVTRNVIDFQLPGLAILNPWDL